MVTVFVQYIFISVERHTKQIWLMKNINVQTNLSESLRYGRGETSRMSTFLTATFPFLVHVWFLLLMSSTWRILLSFSLSLFFFLQKKINRSLCPRSSALCITTSTGILSGSAKIENWSGSVQTSLRRDLDFTEQTSPKKQSESLGDKPGVVYLRTSVYSWTPLERTSEVSVRTESNIVSDTVVS